MCIWIQHSKVVSDSKNLLSLNLSRLWRLSSYDHDFGFWMIIDQLSTFRGTCASEFITAQELQLQTFSRSCLSIINQFWSMENISKDSWKMELTRDIDLKEKQNGIPKNLTILHYRHTWQNTQLNLKVTLCIISLTNYLFQFCEYFPQFSYVL